jgi:uncharacterized protein YecE (DUF72 family)
MVDQSASQAGASAVRFGCSSFSSDDWVGPFYPAGTRPADYLRHYSTQFDTVEIDATYYAIPRASVVDGWFDKTPEGFLIAAKFPRSMVHAGKGAIPDGSKVLVPEETYHERDEFLRVMSRLGERLGPLVLQFPYFSKKVFPSENQFIDRLDTFLGDLPGEFNYAVEVRNRQWFTPELAYLLRSHNVALVLVDQAWMPHADEVLDRFDPVTGSFCYIRLLGDRKEIEAITDTWGEEVIDRRERLRRWAIVLNRMVERQVPTLVYVNNHYAGHAPATVRRLREFYAEAPEARG